MIDRTPSNRASVRLTRVAGALCIGSGALVLTGWVASVPALKSVVPGLVAMNPLTALCFMASGCALISLASAPDGRSRRIVPIAIGLIVLLAAASKLCDIAFGWTLGADQILFRSRLAESGVPNRMAPNTALAFAFSGLSLALLGTGRRGAAPAAQILIQVPLLLSLLACIGYAYGAKPFYEVPAFIPMAINTAVTFATLSAGILAARPRDGIMRMITSEDAGGLLARRLIPLAVLVPAALGWIELQLQIGLRYGPQLGNSLLVASSVLVSVLFIVATARRLGAADAERRRALESLRQANDSLEGRVAERTRDLARTIHDLETEVDERERAEKALRQSEEQLRQSQKMDAVGRLAGGVAHDFNNLLTAILGYSQLMRAKLKPEDPLRSDTVEIEKAAVRAAALTRQLLAFSRQQILQPKVLDLNAIVTDMDRMIRRLVPSNIDVVTAAAADLGRVKADPGQLEQVILNLVVNARDAMPAGGRLTIETMNVGVDDLYARGRDALVPGRYVLLSVSDDGQGMDEAVRSRIFEPFFTTKEVGKGTGLGLSTVHGIVKQSGGHIEVYSEKDRGSAFKVYLPRVEAELDPTVMADLATPPAPGTETLLLVEDEDLVRSAVRETLIAAGYKVLEATNGEEALALWAAGASEFDLLLTDVVMPRMGGPELVRKLADAGSQVRVLFMSGYTDRAIVHQGVLDPGTEFLQKPFTAAALMRKVRAVLDAPGSRAA
jgi:signal transduction histidine kinase/ActR/RegA family two-component response regulator